MKSDIKSCLIVDDSRVVRKVAARIASDMGFRTREAEDGDQAFQFCSESMPDAIILDWNMPVMSGLEFVEKLRLMHDGERPKVIFCTTENDLMHVQRALRAGADEYIMKPFNSDVVHAKFAQVGLLDIVQA
jgi:two-component system chemotaxis response regulator CheY